VAVVLALRNRTTLYSYLSAFDPDYEQLGFGRELLGQAIRYAHEHGYRTWNFMRGDEPYKYSWGARPIPKCRLILEASRQVDQNAIWQPLTDRGSDSAGTRPSPDSK